MTIRHSGQLNAVPPVSSPAESAYARTTKKPPVRTLAALLLSGMLSGYAMADQLDEVFAKPTPEAGLRAYWWWLNGNVDKAAITKDLEAFKANHFGGALICDAGGATQGGHHPVPAGPMYMSAEWRELFKHTVKEADRLGLEISVNIQSGWNLGGPGVTPEFASKTVTYSETMVTGPGKINRLLAEPKARLDYYRDIAVLAWPMRAGAASTTPFDAATANNSQDTHLPPLAFDGDRETFWVSQGAKFGDGPTPAKPHWLQLSFKEAVEADMLTLLGRPGYSPRDCELQASDDGKAFRKLAAFAVTDGKEAIVKFEKTKAAHFRVVITRAFDKGMSNTPRNAQIAELTLKGPALAFPSVAAGRRPIVNLADKAVFKEVGFSAPVTWPLLEDLPGTPGEEDCTAKDIVNLTAKMDQTGKLDWEAPAGKWTVLRIGYTPTGAQVSTSSDTWKGLALDHLSQKAFRTYWDRSVAPLIADAGPLAGKTLKYVHTDSWELGGTNWTDTFADEFRQRRGYDITPFLPVMCGKIINSRDESVRFLADLRKTVGDLVADNHYAVMAELAHQHGMGTHPESGGPHGAPVDALKCLGRGDVPMNEFWAPSPHRATDINRFFTKQAASAAHIYGKRIVNAEGPTSIGPQWDEIPAVHVKTPFDREICAGLNRVVWHAVTCSPASMGIPGQEYFAGTHFDPQITWWEQSRAMTLYLTRVQQMMLSGQFVADVCYYYGDHVPSFVRLKEDDPAKILPGYDYDVINEEAMLTRMSVKGGRLTLPDGMSYAMLVLPEKPILSMGAATKIAQLAREGATILGPRPVRTVTLTNYPQCEKDLAAIADGLWGKSSPNTVGKGKVFTDVSAREVLTTLKIAPDFEARGAAADTQIDYIHRRAGDAEIYFIANRQPRAEVFVASLRASGKQPELWDAVSGDTRPALAFTQQDGRTLVPLELPPSGSIFVVLRKAIGADVGGTARNNFRTIRAAGEIAGPWRVTFPPKWGSPESAEFDKLVSWPDRSEPGIRAFSGKATYHKTFDLPPGVDPARQQVLLELGQVAVVAQVRLNGKDLGVLWTPPFRCDITTAVKPAGNELEIDVVNGWLNRVLADQDLPPDQKLTKTNIVLAKGRKPMESGLLGPVRLMIAE